LSSLYLSTVKQALAGALVQSPSVGPSLVATQEELLIADYDADLRKKGLDWPLYGQTMIGILRLDNIQQVLEEVHSKAIPGDFVECGVWRGGASIFARAVMKTLEITDRKVHVIDSFQVCVMS